jgi:hypothetical protein
MLGLKATVNTVITLHATVNSMEQNSLPEHNSRSARQDIAKLLSNKLYTPASYLPFPLTKIPFWSISFAHNSVKVYHFWTDTT